MQILITMDSKYSSNDYSAVFFQYIPIRKLTEKKKKCPFKLNSVAKFTDW